MLFLTCCVLKLINILHFNQEIKLKNTIVENGPSKMEFYGSRHLKSRLEQIPSALAATFLIGISTTFQLAQPLWHTLLTEATFSNNKTTLHGSWSCFSPAMETEKQRQEPAFQPLPFLEIRCSHNFSISTSHCCQTKFSSKIGWSLPYSLKNSRALKLNLGHNWILQSVEFYFLLSCLAKALFYTAQHHST